ncbi:MBL fold metallo-hydrolase [Thalassotalea ganghwensis]
MIFRQLFDSKSSTYTYLLADEKSKKALLIDPVLEQVSRDIALIKELSLTLEYTLDTHCHADHVTGAWLIKQKLGSKIACAKQIGAKHTDVALCDGDIISCGELALEVRATPGHTDGCLTYINHKERMAFTGDALLIRGCGRSDFQQGNAASLYDSITEKIFTLADDYQIFPGHDYSGRCSSTVSEEKQFNIRIGGNANKQDFVGYMTNMHLPHPKFIDVALPANLKCGELSNMPEEITWAPTELNYAAIPEVSPQWVAEHLNSVTILDVREPEETQISHIENAIMIPLGELTCKIATLPTNKPIITFCRSGRRSALAVSQLNDAGITKIANLRGGIIDWQAHNYPLIENTLDKYR